LRDVVRAYKKKIGESEAMLPLEETTEIILPSKEVTASIIFEAHKSIEKSRFSYNVLLSIN
jgi:hypothetical protein